MSSLRRTKNFATDPQTPMFLYTILKQLDLRSINWNEVADSLGISNGHAARMRYSRMRSQFEGLSNQPKPPKPKKENTGESKSSKAKAKNNKRLLMEEENERIASSRPPFQHAMQPESDPKRIKIEPQSYTNAWNSTSMYTEYPTQPGAATYWGQPAIKTEPLPFGIPSMPPQITPTTPAIKQEPGSAAVLSDHVPASTAAIKQESDTSVQDSDVAESDLIVVKREQRTTNTEQTTPLLAYPANDASSYPVSHTISAYFDRQQKPMPATQAYSSSHGMPGYLPSQAFPHGAYGATNAYNTAQSAFSWTTSIPGQHAPVATLMDDSNNMMLNPYATTYQDMLNMPLYRRSSSILQIPDPSSQQVTTPTPSKGAETGGEGVGASEKAPAILAVVSEQQVLSGDMTSASVVAPIDSSEPVTVNSDSNPPGTSAGQALPTANVIEVESDTEVEAEAAHDEVVNHVGQAKVKNEVVEL
ncbi:hypothetical protein H2200_009971 [Cladophialophora chaetospira]|uniref:Myb-like DNA-binding domain-containing protein n=1 Tax=Cladophialophora chaetospira TaxID=386627 RepID=A0AA39CEK0_9EURO|nr:hypothetical protein H2200_009971 [Cladophialophora chaetospira]